MIIGTRNLSAIGTLVERTTGYTLLLHLPEGYRPEQVRDALAAKIQTLPETLRGSLTWDQGPEMRDWQQVAVAADIDIFFCDPHAPWQRGINENTVSLVVARLARPPASNLDRPRPSLDDRAAHRAAQRDVAVETIARYNPQAVVCVGIPCGHTRPQWILPYGGEVTVDGARHAVWADYR